MKEVLELLRPLDLQTIIPRSLDVQRLQQIQNQRPAIEQQQFSQELTHFYEERQNRVEQAVASSEGEKIRQDVSDDPSKQSAPRYRRFYGKKKPSDEEQTEIRRPDGPGQHIDIKI
ncbi:MAG TPA: hypothetical protein VEC37_09045 [Bacillota bacterium]|nr:hypothetical protein [Bacillota bacterium]